MVPAGQTRSATRLGDAPIRVVHVVHSFETGGLEKGVATLASHASPDIQHIVLCLTRSGDSYRLLPPGTPLIELCKRPGHSLRFIFKLSRRLRELEPDVVHTRNWPGMDGILAARLAGIRNVVHGEHGWGVEDTYGRNRRRVMVRRALSHWVREYTCVSRQMIRWLRDEIRIVKPVTQIYNGVDTEAYRPDVDGARVRVDLGIAQDAFVVGVVGRLDPIKNHAVLFEAFAGVRESVPDAVLLVIGDGPESERLSRAAGTGVRLLGNRNDLPQLLGALDVFVLPSLNEGISNTILEAMAAALPVVATGVGGTPELIGDGSTGTLVPAGDAEAIRTALQRYHASRERRREHGEAARRKVVAEFSIDRMTGAYETVWRRVAGVRQPEAGRS
jgi:sugar transferase (PEP-CTERM/EpsH1 system associated)